MHELQPLAISHHLTYQYCQAKLQAPSFVNDAGQNIKAELSLDRCIRVRQAAESHTYNVEGLLTFSASIPAERWALDLGGCNKSAVMRVPRRCNI